MEMVRMAATVNGDVRVQEDSLTEEDAEYSSAIVHHCSNMTRSGFLRSLAEVLPLSQFQNPSLGNNAAEASTCTLL